MNILPKKRWHVRTRENIARVRKDEAEAAAEAKEKEERVLLAEKEARTSLLRERARQRYGSLPVKSEEITIKNEVKSELQHVNFFEDIEEGKVILTKKNAEAEHEKKEEREKYEKSIGYLTYLGQNTVELTGKIPWYDQVPPHAKWSTEKDAEVKSKSKELLDPLTTIKKYMPEKEMTSKRKCESQKKDYSIQSKVRTEQKYKKWKKKKKKMKKQKKSDREKHKRSCSCSESNTSSSSEEEEVEKESMRYDLEKLRAERLKREQQEKRRAEELLAKLRGETISEQPKEQRSSSVIKQKYNSQYNPELAKQNFSHYTKN